MARSLEFKIASHPAGSEGSLTLELGLPQCAFLCCNNHRYTHTQRRLQHHASYPSPSTALALRNIKNFHYLYQALMR